MGKHVILQPCQGDNNDMEVDDLQPGSASESPLRNKSQCSVSSASRAGGFKLKGKWNQAPPASGPSLNEADGALVAEQAASMWETVKEREKTEDINPNAGALRNLSMP